MRFFALGLGLALIACTAPPKVIAPVVDAGLTLQWSACTLETTTQQPAECATVQVPLNWSEPTGRTISLSLKRYRSPRLASRGALWLLAGGPGAPVTGLEASAPYFARGGVALDFYMLDQRGTGRSSRLGCPGYEAQGITADEWAGCLDEVKAQWPDGGLDGFSVTNTAHDLGALIEATRGEGDEVFLYGVSYATYLLNRYLQLYPSQATGVVLDSICGADACRSSQSDARFNEVAHAYFDACARDAFCAARLGPDPWGRFGSMLDGLDAHKCPAATAAGVTRETLRGAFAQLLYDWEQRALIPAMVRRLERCGPKDVPVIEHFGRLLNPAPSTTVPAFSSVLATHIALSELWDEPSPSAEVFAAQTRAQYVSNALGVRLAGLQDQWPRVPHDAWWGQWASTSTPMLLMNGTLDPATPISTQAGARAAFVGPAQTFVEMPGASHGVLLNSLVTGAPPCGTSLMIAFLANPQAALDLSCTQKVNPVTFNRSAAAPDYFGTADLWGD